MGSSPTPRANNAEVEDLGVRRFDTLTFVLTETRPTPERSSGDQLMRRVLRIDDAAAESNEEAQSAFQKSILISAIRCTLTYVLIPFVVPVLGFAAAVDAPLGIALSIVAIISVTYSLRKFFGSDHPRRWQYASLAGVLLVFVTALLIRDVLRLVG